MLALLYYHYCIRERKKKQAGLNQKQEQHKETSQTKPKIRQRIQKHADQAKHKG
jgi:hypothetical protein